MCWVYILRSGKDGRFYIGSTKDLEKRLARHSAGRVPATKSRLPMTLVYSERYPTLADAYQREKEIKAEKSALFIERLLRKHGQDPVV